MKIKDLPKIDRPREKLTSKQCVICGKNLLVTILSDKSYSGGHYFGKILISSKAEWAKAMKAGTHASRLGRIKIQILNYDPKPYKHIEYWECNRCFTK